MNEYGDRTNKKLLEVYEEFGLIPTIKFCRELLKNNTNKTDMDFLAGVHGEICETVLEVLILEYIKRFNKKDWYLSKSLILPIPGTSHTTELDLVLFTPQTIFVFECKCYGGNKRVTDKCLINRDRYAPFDVFKQNFNHLKWLNHYCSPYERQSRDTIPYTISYFRFDNGTLVDLRKKEDKEIFPITEVDTLYALIAERTNVKGKSWDMRLINEIKKLEKNRSKLAKSHLKQVLKNTK